MDIISAFFLISGVIILSLLYSSLSWGFVVLKFWGWFMLPVFPQLPHIVFPQAVGLAFFIGLFHNHTISRPITEEDKHRAHGVALIVPWVTVLIGYVIHLFIS